MFYNLLIDSILPIPLINVGNQTLLIQMLLTYHHSMSSASLEQSVPRRATHIGEWTCAIALTLHPSSYILLKFHSPAHQRYKPVFKRKGTAPQSRRKRLRDRGAALYYMDKLPDGSVAAP